MTKKNTQRQNAKAPRIQDSLTSLATSLGQRQKAQYYEREPELTQEQLLTLWQTSWVVQKICKKKSRDMVRKWREIKCNDLTAEQIEKIENIERTLKLRETMENALMWASLLGGVALLIVTDEEESHPLGEGEEIKKIVLLFPRQVTAEGPIDTDLLSDNFGKPTFYGITGTKGGHFSVHHSRLIFINAIERSPFDVNSLFGISDIQPLYDTLKRYDALSTATGDLVEEAKVDVYKMEGLANQLTTKDGESIVFNTMRTLQLIKSSTNAIILDKENEYEQKQFTFAGLKDLLVEYRNAVAGAADMPLTVLFGQSASGFASGEEDAENYFASIHAMQESRLRPALERLDVLIAEKAIGFFPQGWWFEFKPLSEESESDKFTNLNTLATALTTLTGAGILTEYQAAVELNKSALISAIPEDEIAEIFGGLDEQENSDY